MENNSHIIRDERRLEIPINENVILVAEPNESEHANELYVCLCDREGTILQDIATVRPRTNAGPGEEESIEVKVFGETENWMRIALVPFEEVRNGK